MAAILSRNRCINVSDSAFFGFVVSFVASRVCSSTLGLRRIWRLFVDDILKCILMREKRRIVKNIHLGQFSITHQLARKFIGTEPAIANTWQIRTVEWRIYAAASYSVLELNCDFHAFGMALISNTCIWIILYWQLLMLFHIEFSLVWCKNIIWITNQQWSYTAIDRK